MIKRVWVSTKQLEDKNHALSRKPENGKVEEYIHRDVVLKAMDFYANQCVKSNGEYFNTQQVLDRELEGAG